MNEKIIIQFIVNGQLEIDSQGFIWRVKVRRGLRGGGTQVVGLKEKKRAEHKTPHGYLQVRALVDDRRIHCLAHRLVWYYHAGEIPEGICVNHINGVKDDNRLDNLELATYSENMKHAHRIGLIDQTGERNPAAKLSNIQVEEIRAKFGRGNIRQVQLAKEYNVSFQTISKIIRGDERKSQGGPISKNNPKNFTKQDSKTGRFVGKKKAGNLLDGMKHEEWPELTEVSE